MVHDREAPRVALPTWGSNSKGNWRGAEADRSHRIRPTDRSIHHTWSGWGRIGARGDERGGKRSFYHQSGGMGNAPPTKNRPWPAIAVTFGLLGLVWRPNDTDGPLRAAESVVACMVLKCKCRANPELNEAASVSPSSIIQRGCGENSYSRKKSQDRVAGPGQWHTAVIPTRAKAGVRCPVSGGYDNSFRAVVWISPRRAQSMSWRDALKCFWSPCWSSVRVTWTSTGA